MHASLIKVLRLLLLTKFLRHYNFSIKINLYLQYDPDEPEVLRLNNVTYDDEGWYTCVAVNSLGSSNSSGYLMVVDELPVDPIQRPIDQDSSMEIFAAILCFVCFIILVWLCILRTNLRRQKQKQRFMKECVNQWTKKVIVLYSSENNNSASDMIQMPKVTIEKQRVSLGAGSCESSMILEYEFPNDVNWEFPRSNLFLGEKLGEGAFGKVFKAEAHGLIKAGVTTEVAVKMLKEGHTDDEVKDLVCEMEVMKIIGNHINVLKLMGCCSQVNSLTNFNFK